MRILMVSHSVLPWTTHFARFFRERGDELLVVSFSSAPLEGVDGIKMEFIGVEPFDPEGNKRLYFARVPRLRRIIRRFRPDLLFAPYLTSNGLSAALAFSGPIVVTAVGSDVMHHATWTGWKRRAREMIVRFVCRRADLINTVSTELGEELMRLGVPASKLLLLPIGVDLERFRPVAEMPRLAASRFICTRRHEPIYGIGTVIEALERLKSAGRGFHCVFTGDGPLRAAHEARVHQAGLSKEVTFTGHRPHAELPGLLCEADVYISASMRDGTSVSLLEAMAAGLLPVVTRIPANEPWIAHGRTGLLFDTERADQLAEMLATALDDAKLRRRALRENRARVDREANMQRNMERLVEAFERLASARGAASGGRRQPGGYAAGPGRRRSL